MKFPRPGSKRFVIAIAGTSGLDSAKRDAKAYITRFKRFGFSPYLCIDSTPARDWVWKECGPCPSLSSVGEISDLLKKLAQIPGELDILITISAHGYGGAGGGSFHFGGQAVSNLTLRQLYTPFESEKRIHLLTLIDTCHAGAIIPRSFRRLQQQHITTIAGCRDSQSLSQDISQQFGWGGGLTTAVMDGLAEEKEFFSTQSLNSYCYGRLLKVGAHTTVVSI